MSVVLAGDGHAYPPHRGDLVHCAPCLGRGLPLAMAPLARAQHPAHPSSTSSLYTPHGSHGITSRHTTLFTVPIGGYLGLGTIILVATIGLPRARALARYHPHLALLTVQGSYNSGAHLCAPCIPCRLAPDASRKVSALAGNTPCLPLSLPTPPLSGGGGGTGWGSQDGCMWSHPCPAICSDSTSSL